jgi:hypothetical protein
MTGHIFHPGHHELHGITVVLETTQARLYVGRFDRQDESGVHMIGVSIFDPAQATPTREDFLARTAKFGVRVDRPHVTVPFNLVLEITPLNSISSS